MTSFRLLHTVLALLLVTKGVASFSAPGVQHHGQLSSSALWARADCTCRRSLLAGILTTAVAIPANGDSGAEVRGIGVTPFNSLMFQYRGSADYTGLKADEIGEPSISYADFMAKLKAGQVASVEFLAPDGDKAYAVFKSADGQLEPPLRIGEGYPIEQHDGWSSPSFAIRAVKNAGVPYKFTVPGLTAFQPSS